MKSDFTINEKLCTTLCQTFGPSGREAAILQYIKSQISDYTDDIFYDGLGSLIAFKKGKDSSKRMMFCAHADEIGLVVTKIDSKGFIRFATVGGVAYTKKLGGQRVIFENGLVGIIALERCSDDLKNDISSFYIDIPSLTCGTSKKSVAIGDFATFVSDTIFQDGFIVSKALDDRIGCYLLIETLKRIGLPAIDSYFVFSVQEEVGARGAATATYMIKPNYAFAVDVTLCGDTLESLPLNMQLTKGVCIKAKDRGIIVQTKVINYLIELCKKNRINYQMEVLPYGATDASTISLVEGGVTSGVLSVACRYVHSASEVVSYKDVASTLMLLIAICQQPFSFGE